MSDRIVTRFLLTFLVAAALAATAHTAKEPPKKQRANPAASRVMQYAFPTTDGYRSTGPAGSLGTTKGSIGRLSASESPGVVIGDTWWDEQHRGSMGRMIDVGNADGLTLVHMAWTRLPGWNSGTLRYQYNYYDADPLFASIHVQGSVSLEWSGDVGCQATDDNRAMVGGQERLSTRFQPHFYWDCEPGGHYFGDHICRLPDSTASYGGTYAQELLWPKFRYQEGSTDTVLHVIAQVSELDPNAPRALYYFRKVGGLNAGDWDYPPVIIDTNFVPSHDIAASKTTNKVALVWTANLVGGDGAANSGLEYPNCSFESGQATFTQMDNDLYYMISNDQGVNWIERENITCNVDGESGFRPYADLSALITTDDNLHIVWSGRVWSADANSGGFIGLNCRLFHWSEDIPLLRTVHSADWHQTDCNGGAWQMNVSKMTISECADRLYVIFTQFNDIPNGIEDDCAQRGVGLNSDDPNGSANGEIYMCVSGDAGLTWDIARNLTNTRTPDCDSATGIGGRCESDHWASMVRLGRENQPGEGWSGAVVIDPAPTGSPHDNDYWLDMQWISDPVAGSVLQDEGSWSLAEVLWARVACVPIVPTQHLAFWPTEIAYPAYTKFEQQLDTPLVIENLGNIHLYYTLTVNELNGPEGWLTESGNDGEIPSGDANREVGTIHLNTGGNVGSPKIAFEPTVELRGNLVFTGEFPTSPDTLHIAFYMADTLYTPTFDTISTGSFSLAVSTNGNMGNQGRGEVNLDWFDVDCDTSEDIPGKTDVYLFDASPVILRVIDYVDLYDPLHTLDTVGWWSIYGDGFLSGNGFVQVTPHTSVTTVGNHDEFYTGCFATRDTNIFVEMTYYAPGSGEANDAFIIQCMKVYGPDVVVDPYAVGEAFEGLSIGMAVDWDIPSDTGFRNTCGSDASRNLFYQMGHEYDAWDDTLECLNNNVRVGGIAFLDMFEPSGGELGPDTLTVWTAMSTTYDGGLAGLQVNIDAAIAWYNANTPGTFVSSSTDFVGAYAMPNDTFVYPTGGLVGAELFRNMNTLHESDQYVCWTDWETETDLHTVMTFVNDFSLTGGCIDWDEDGVGCSDNCPVTYNPGQEDSDHDGIGDACSFAASTPSGEDVTIELGTEISMIFDQVTEPGTTEMIVTLARYTGYYGIKIIPVSSPASYNITTTATFDGSIEVCIHYDDQDVTYGEALLTLQHYNGMDWDDITSSLDISANVICGITTSLSEFAIAYPGFCCTGIRGNANGDGNEDINISDITFLVDYLFGIPLGAPPPCLPEGNANGDPEENINISDITYLVDYLFGVPLGPAPPACP